jgi:hypothetical protein
MKWSCAFVFAGVLALSMAPARGQELTRLRIDVTRSGSLVAKPELKVEAGREGRLELSGESLSKPNAVLQGLRERITITPVVRGDDIALAFKIVSGDKQFTPELVISDDIRGSVEWTAADGQPIMLTVSWVR